jgi:hypothetical protein
MFNLKDGFIEALVRGHRMEFLSNQDYSDLSQCETLEDVRTFLVLSFFFSLFGRANKYVVGYWLWFRNRCASEANIFASIHNCFSLHGKTGSGFQNHAKSGQVKSVLFVTNEFESRQVNRWQLFWIFSHMVT